MAVGDTIVGIQGTGTELDPYQVTDLTEVLEAIAVENAYVKLMNDIELIYSPEYRNGIQQSLVFNCAKFYSDSSYSIYGLKIYISGVDFIQGTSITLVENVNFLSCYFYSSANNDPSERSFMISSTATDDHLNFNNCKLSIITSIYRLNVDKCIICAPRVSFTDCSIYLKFRLRYTSGNLSSSTIALWLGETTRCYIRLDGIKLNHNLSSGGPTIFYNTNNSTLILPNYYYSSGGGGGTTGITGSICYSNIIYIQGSYNMYGTSSASARIDFNGSALSIACINLTKLASGDVSLTNTTSATIDQIKDQQYLIDTGFIPS